MEEEKKILNESELNTVAAGDYGDSESEVDACGRVHYMYNVGDVVEMYNTAFHLTTTRGTIVKRYTVYTSYGQTYVALYDIQLENGQLRTTVEADQIQRG